MEIKPYKKDSEYSYALGAFVTFELIDAAPEYVEKVLVHSTFTDKEKLMRMCAGRRIPVETNDKLIAKLPDRKTFLLSEFSRSSRAGSTARDRILFLTILPTWAILARSCVHLAVWASLMWRSSVTELTCLIRKP